MAQEYSRAALRVCVAQICQHLGWNSIQATPLELLTDVLERYILELGKTTHRYSNQFGRTDARLEDVILAYEHMGIQIPDMINYVKHVEPLPFAQEVVAFPAPSQNDLKFPNPDSKEVQQRKVFDFVPEYLPYMHPELNEEEEEAEEQNQSVMVAPPSPEKLQVEPQATELSLSPSATSLQPGEKRPAPSPTDSPQTFKRPRLTTSQLPEEATQSQYEMTSVMMTNSGILSSMLEGKAPDPKKPPQGIKQNVIIVRQRSGSTTGKPSTPGAALSGGSGSVIHLDFNKDPSKGGRIIAIDEGTEAGAVKDRTDPDYKPKKNKKFRMKDFKLNEKLIKIKRGPGRPRGALNRGAVVHNKHTKDFKIPKIGEKPIVPPNPNVALDLSVKPTPPAPNISVVKVPDDHQDLHGNTVEYRPKPQSLSKEQEQDMDDTIDSVIGKTERKITEYEVKEISLSEGKEKKKKKSSDQWTVSQISESFSADDDNDSDPGVTDSQDADVVPSYPPPVIAPHLMLLQGGMSQTPRPRGRPKGSTSGFHRSLSGRSPMGRRPGRPPLHRSPGRSPGRPPGRPPLSRSPGSVARSPGRPPLNRSPGRPPLNRSPGRPKNPLGLSPRPRGRPRGSKSPRTASPRGGSPRGPITNLSFDETNESSSTRIFKHDTDESNSTSFNFSSKASPAPSMSPRKDLMSPTSPPPHSPAPRMARTSSDSSAAPTEPALSRENTPDLPDSPVKQEMSPTPEKDIPIRVPDYPVKRESVSPVRGHVTSLLRESQERERSHKIQERSPSEESDRKSFKFEKDSSSQDRESENTRGFSSDRDTEPDIVKDTKIKEIKKEREVKEKSLEREREFKEPSREKDFMNIAREKEREHKEKKEKHRDRDGTKDRSREHSKEHSRERDHKERSKDRDREHKDHRDKNRDKSKDHRKDKKKKKKKNRERDKEREKEEGEKRDKHKSKEKERGQSEEKSREESPSIAPLQKLKIKFGGGTSSSSTSFSIAASKPKDNISPPKQEKTDLPSPKPELIIPKLKFKVMPPKSDISGEKDSRSWVSSIKEERKKSPAPKHDALYSSPKSSPKPSPKPLQSIDTDSDVDSKDEDDEVTVSVVKGKIIKKSDKKAKRKSSKKGKSKGESSRKSLDSARLHPDKISAIKREIEKESSPISPGFSPQNVPSPITIPALKAAPPPPSPPAAVKKSVSKLKTGKDSRPQSPLVKDVLKTSPPPKPQPKTQSKKPSPKKSPKISPLSKKKGGGTPSPTPSSSKSFSLMDFQTPHTPSPRRSSSPLASAPSSPMYSPPSSPGHDDSPLHFQIPPTPAFPTRTHSPSPPSRQLSEEIETVSRPMSTDEEPDTPTSADKPIPPAPFLPPMPPTSAQKQAQKSTPGIITETVGSFVNERGEQIWICPACTMQDDGSPMIGCDKCDDWYHWVCVNITSEPDEDESWFCRKCSKPSKSSKSGGKRGRKKKTGK